MGKDEAFAGMSHPKMLMEESRTKEDVTKPRERQTAGNRPLKTQFMDERKRQQK